MAFASEFELEDELERECRPEECKVIDDPSVKWDMPSLWLCPAYSSAGQHLSLSGPLSLCGCRGLIGTGPLRRQRRMTLAVP